MTQHYLEVHFANSDGAAGCFYYQGSFGGQVRSYESLEAAEKAAKEVLASEKSYHKVHIIQFGQSQPAKVVE